jgi:GNAT superfamily N-acetyltransferase
MARKAPYRFREVDESTWDDMVRLFDGRGGPSYCWCLLWRESAAARANLDRPGRRRAMQRRVTAGTPVGLLAYDGDEPVAWCSVAPRETYRSIGGIDYPDGTSVWSVVCFFIKRDYRGQGLSAALLDAAVKTARHHGAEVVEASPVGADSHSYRFMGFRSTFEAAGFEELRMAGTRRHVMHRILTARLRRQIAGTQERHVAGAAHPEPVEDRGAAAARERKLRPRRSS